MLLWICILLLFCYMAGAHKLPVNPTSPILVVGATGSTGLRAIQGLLDVGYQPQQIHLLTRNASKPNVMALKQAGFTIQQANLEDPKSLQQVTKGCTGCYIHSTSSDIPELDKEEVPRARNLCHAIVTQGNIRHVVYNSAAGGKNHGVARIEQKHGVEQVFLDAIDDAEASDKLTFTSLRATIFMEELWKVYTRPKILAGQYPLPVRASKKIFLVSVRDMGRLAGYLVAKKKGNNNNYEHNLSLLLKDNTSSSSSSSAILNVAGDTLTGPEIAKAFATAQESPCKHINPRLFTFKAWLNFRELYEQIRFLQKSKETADMDGLEQEFPGLLTSFATFLEETGWGNQDRTFADLSKLSDLIVYE